MKDNRENKRSVGATLKCAHLLALLEENKLYTPATIAALGADRKTEPTKYHRYRKSLAKFAGYHCFHATVDGKVNGYDAWFGSRWTSHAKPEDIREMSAELRKTTLGSLPVPKRSRHWQKCFKRFAVFCLPGLLFYSLVVGFLLFKQQVRLKQVAALQRNLAISLKDRDRIEESKRKLWAAWLKNRDRGRFQVFNELRRLNTLEGKQQFTLNPATDWRHTTTLALVENPMFMRTDDSAFFKNLP